MFNYWVTNSPSSELSFSLLLSMHLPSETVPIVSDSLILYRELGICDGRHTLGKRRGISANWTWTRNERTIQLLVRLWIEVTFLFCLNVAQNSNRKCYINCPREMHYKTIKWNQQLYSLFLESALKHYHSSRGLQSSHGSGRTAPTKQQPLLLLWWSLPYATAPCLRHPLWLLSLSDQPTVSTQQPQLVNLSSLHLFQIPPTPSNVLASVVLVLSLQTQSRRQLSVPDAMISLVLSQWQRAWSTRNRELLRSSLKGRTKKPSSVWSATAATLAQLQVWDASTLASTPATGLLLLASEHERSSNVKSQTYFLSTYC